MALTHQIRCIDLEFFVDLFIFIQAEEQIDEFKNFPVSFIKGSSILVPVIKNEELT